MIKWRETAGQAVAVMAFQFHRNGTVLTGMRTAANVHTQHLGPHCRLAGMELNIGLSFLFLFTAFINVAALQEGFPPHHSHTHTRAHAESSAVFLRTAIIPL